VSLYVEFSHFFFRSADSGSGALRPMVDIKSTFDTQLPSPHVHGPGHG
jgi:hypothetical protein